MDKFTRNALFVLLGLAATGSVFVWRELYRFNTSDAPFLGRWESEGGIAVTFNNDRTALFNLPKEAPQALHYEIVQPQDWVDARGISTELKTSAEELFPGVTHVVRLYSSEAPDEFNPSRNFFYNAESDSLVIPMLAEFRRASQDIEPRPNLAQFWFLEDEGGFWAGSLRLDTDGRFVMYTGPFRSNMVEREGKWSVKGSKLVLSSGGSDSFLHFVDNHATALRYERSKSAYSGLMALNGANYSPEYIKNAEANLTSNIGGVFALAQPHMEPQTPNYAKLYLVRKIKGDWQKVAYLGVRYDAEKPDKLFRTDRVIAALAYVSATGGYCHYLFMYDANRFMRLNDPALGSSTVIKMGDSLIGTVWNSPDFSEPSGNKLYVLEPEGIRWFDLGGDTQRFYEVERVSDKEFRVIRLEEGGKRTVYRHSFPIPYNVDTLSFDQH